MAWISVHQQIADHRKTRKLFRKLKISRQEAIGYLVLIWLWALDNADRDGKLLATTVEDIERAGYWAGEPGVLYKALVDCQWIDEIDGNIYLHDWYDFNKPFYQYTDRKEKDRARKFHGNSTEKPAEIPHGFHDSPAPAPAPLPLKQEEQEEDARAREGRVFEFFQQNVGMITPFQSETIGQYLDDGLEPELIIAIMQDSQGTDNKWRWMQTVLQNSFEQGIKTVEQYEAKKAEKKERIEARARDKPPSRAEQKRDAILKAREEANKRLKELGVIPDDSS